MDFAAAAANERITAGTTTLAHLVSAMLFLGKRNQLCSLRAVWREKNLSFGSPNDTA
jgi:hypothetical protein